MNFCLGYFADTAQWVDGKLYLFGGCLTRYKGSPFPLTVPSLGVVFHLLCQPHEFGKQQRLTAGIGQVNGEKLPLEIDVPVVPLPNPEHPDRPNTYVLVLTIQNLQFPQPGEYILQVAIEGRPVGALSFDLIDSGSETPRAAQQ
jgi:hypothetical protein